MGQHWEGIIMIKIDKFENIYGIKSLKGAESLGKINIIYAPNGTAKTSIADALEMISNQQIPTDVYGGTGVPSFKIDVNGDVLTESNYVNFNMLKYSGTQDYVLKDADYSRLVISAKTQLKFKGIVDNIKKYSNDAITLIKSAFPKKNALKGFADMLEMIACTSESDFYFAKNLLENLKLTTTVSLSSEFTEEEIINFINNKCKQLCSNNEVKINSSIYFSAISKISSNNIIDENFTAENLNKFNDSIKDTNYFDDNGQRALNINGEKISKEKFASIVNDVNEELYGSDEARNSFENIKKLISKSLKIEAVLKNHKEIVGMLSDFDELSRRILFTYFGPKTITSLNDLLSKILAEKVKLDALMSSIDSSDSKLHNIWNRYKSRFKFEKFDLDIRNKFNSIIGNDIPSFVKLIPGTETEISNPRNYRFSTGEIKTFYLINFILEVERNRLSGAECLLVLDDAADSFDYKNKYGLIDYLLDIADDPKIQILLLTHNFDFYRSATLAIGESKVSNYFAQKQDNGDVVLINTSTDKYFLSVSNFNAWKNSNKLIKYIAMIPFYRNVFQLESNAKDGRVIDLDKYLHYDNTTESLTFVELESHFSPIGFRFPTSASKNDLYLDKLLSECNALPSSPITEKELDKKLFLGISLRVLSEKLLYKIIDENGGILTFTDNEMYNKGRVMYNRAEPYLNDEEKEKIIEINVISPSYAHANSFMYEPLIDVSADKLVECYQWLKNTLSRRGY